jgi:hypothetical protein
MKTAAIVTVVCEQCGQQFRVTPKRRPGGPQPARFCSKECHYQSQRGRAWGNGLNPHPPITLTCKECGQTFSVAYAYRPDGPKPTGGYCSRKCVGSAHSRGVYPHVGYQPGHTQTQHLWGRVPWNKGRKCPELSGERNGMFGRTHTPEIRAQLSRLASAQLSELTRRRLAGAVAPMRRSEPEYSRLFRIGWRPARRAALERDGQTCQVCGARPKRINVHHIVPFGLVLKHELTNLITLCEPCHSRVHRGALELAAGAADPVLEDVGLPAAEDAA